MRFPLVIPPLLLLILNWSSLDSDAVALHNGSFVAVKSLDHIQSANISSIDGNFATRNTRFRKSSTHDVKSLSDNDDNSDETVSSQFTRDLHGSRGKRQTRDSQEDELAQAEKNVTDLTSEISRISQELKEKEEESRKANKNYEETKNEWDRQSNLLEVWIEWEAAVKAAKKTERELTNAEQALNATKDAVTEAENELQRVKDEPETLTNLTRDLPGVEAEELALIAAVDAIDLSELQNAATIAKDERDSVKSEVDRGGCYGPGKESDRYCMSNLRLLKKLETDLTTAETNLANGERDLPIKNKELGICQENLKDMRAKKSDLTKSVRKNTDNLKDATEDVNEKKSAQVKAQEKYDIALKTRKDAGEALKAKETAKTKAEESGSGNRDAIVAAIKSAKMNFLKANTTKDIIADEIEELKTKLEGKNGELALATAELNALKQKTEKEKKDKPKTGALMYIGIGACVGILLIILAIGGILFTVKRRKSKKKEEPSPTINPDALKFEKVPALDKSNQESASQLSSSKGATPAKSDTNIAATQLTSNKGATPAKSDTNVAATQLSSSKGATPAKSDTNVAATQLSSSKGATPAKSDTNLEGRIKDYRNAAHVYKGPKGELKPRPIPASPTKHETVAVDEINYIDKRRPLINEIAKPTNSSATRPHAQLPSKLRWAEKKAIAMQFGGEELEPVPKYVKLHEKQDEERIEKECDDTEYERRAPEPDKRTGRDLLNEHDKDKTSVDDALKMATLVFIAVHRKLNPTFTALLQLAAAARNVLKKESQLVECGLPVSIFGDIHGQVGDAVRMINLATFDAANPNSRLLDLNNQHLVFCGDYVDRGNRQVETLMLLFSLKVAYPNNVHLLRGNHETREVNYKYGFRGELRDRYGEDEGMKLFDVFNEVFDDLPLSCLIGGKILCVHGGISTKLLNLEDIKKIPKPLSNINDSPLAVDLLWADPVNGMAGTKVNDKRGISIQFGEDELVDALKRTGVIVIFRGHQVPLNGFAWFGMHGQLCTLFVAYNSSTKNNYAACIRIDEQGLKEMLIMYKGRWEEDNIAKLVHACEHEENNEKDEDYTRFREEDEGPNEMDQTMCANGTLL